MGLPCLLPVPASLPWAVGHLRGADAACSSGLLQPWVLGGGLEGGRLCIALPQGSWCQPEQWAAAVGLCLCDTICLLRTPALPRLLSTLQGPPLGSFRASLSLRQRDGSSACSELGQGCPSPAPRGGASASATAINLWLKSQHLWRPPENWKVRLRRQKCELLLLLGLVPRRLCK